MATNKKGEQTREYIYMISKELFYRNGYSGTTLSKIALKAEVPIGLIPYHFKNKDNIVSLIYADFLNKIRTCVESRLHKRSANSILYHGVVSRIYYQIIFSDPNNKKFYHEILLKKSNYKLLHGPIGDIYTNYLKDFNVHISKTGFSDILHADFGARREVFLNKFESPEKTDIQDLVTFANGIVPRLLKIDQTLVDEILHESYEIFKSLSYDHIKLLI
ncbi:TetR/AcrR family transcriptional regulator [Alkalibacter mobilis]|uniref:TetR/AcrR family transcriptional regulator n=1 Tax=Alkalibacter mobilis TaxID=2787712 RepID=UPI00189D8C83|nr:TetR/AcrR family transcriptional regulator [Alkalibacter mobilis]MBF7096025.1 TetR/AcrR family transcriptional regulator [Alkalibacter mobilis]